MLTVLYAVLISLAILDAFLVSPALARSTHAQTTGRLISTLFVLAGIVLASSGRIFNLLFLVVIGLLCMIGGLTGYAFTLPEHNLLDRMRRR